MNNSIHVDEDISSALYKLKDIIVLQSNFALDFNFLCTKH